MERMVGRQELSEALGVTVRAIDGLRRNGAISDGVMVTPRKRKWYEHEIIEYLDSKKVDQQNGATQ